MRARPDPGQTKRTRPGNAKDGWDSVGKNPEEPIHDLVPIFGMDLLREIHRAFHVGEEHRHLLALAFKGAPRCEDLLGEMLRSVGAWVSSFAAAPSGFPQSPQNRSPG